MKSRIHLSEHFTYSKLLRFTLPTIVMNIFLSLYIIVDGYFIANFVGKTEFAASSSLAQCYCCRCCLALTASGLPLFSPN